MQILSGKLPNFVLGGMILGGVPLLAFILLLANLMAAMNAGQPFSGDAIGLAMMFTLSYALALLCFALGVAYFGYQAARHKRYPKIWHRIVLAVLVADLAAPPIFLLNA